MAKAGSKIKSAVSKAKSAVKNYASNVKGGAGIVAGAVKTAINKVGAKNMTGNALQATTLPGAGKVFTGNTPQQKAKSASAQQVVSQGKKVYANGTAIPAGTKQGKLVGQYITTGNSTTGTSTGFKVPMRNDAQANNAYGQPISTEGVMTNESSLTQNQVQGIQGRTSLPTTSVINAPNLGNVQRMTFPTKEDTFIPQIAPIELSTEQQLGMAQNESQNNFQQYLDRLAPPPSSEEAYQRAQRETGLLEKQQKFNELSGRLNAIVNQGEANKLSVIGQGRGIPEAILGGQQAQFARETAIQALPVQAQLSVAQGDLEMAEQNLNTLFKIYSDDATNEYNYKKSVNEAIYQFTDKQTQSRIAELQKKQDREYNKIQEDIKMKQDLALVSAKNGAPASTLSKIVNAKDFSTAIQSAGSYVMSYQDKKARAEYNELVNPTKVSGVVPPPALKDFKSADREAFTQARATLSEVNEIQQIINRNPNNLKQLEVGIGADALRFRQLRANVVDKLARERTGAVIGKDEKRDFKRILGVGFSALALKDINQINQSLETFKNKHNETVRIIDPDGSIGNFLNSTTPLNLANSIINQYAQTTTGSSALNSY